MNKITLSVMVTTLTVCLYADVSVVQSVRPYLDGVIREEHLNDGWSGSIFNYGIMFATNTSYKALSQIVSNNWQEVLANLDTCATNQLERLLILGTRDQFDANYYMDFMDRLVTMKTNGVITAAEFSFVRMSRVPEFERFFVRKYREPRVRALVERIKIAQPARSLYWEKVLSGEAYFNYLKEVKAGLWGDNPPID